MKNLRKAVLTLTIFLLTSGLLTLAQSNPVPLIDNPLVPASVAPGGPSFTLTVNGTGFVSGSAVNWNGAPLATTYVTTSQLTATVPGSNIALAGTASVTVASPGSAASNTIFFQVIPPSPTVAFAAVPVSDTVFPDLFVAADFNGDGMLDIAGAIFGGSEVWVQLGNGDGSFQSPVAYAATSTTYLVARDFNNDGITDIAALNLSCSVSIYLGNGDGTFQPQIVSPSAGSECTTMQAADFDRNGKLDLATLGYDGDGGIGILLGNGNGMFQTGSFLPLPYFTTFAVGDFNGDGNLDLGANGESTNGYYDLDIALGNGDGTFQPASSYLNFRAGQYLVADFNLDGKLDIAGPNEDYGPARFSILLGNGDGTFQPELDYLTNPSYFAYSTISGDFNGDGTLDVVQNNALSIGVLLGVAEGGFQPFFSTGQTGMAESNETAAGDFNGDGRLDLISDGFSPNGLTVFFNSTVALSPSSLTFPTRLVDTTSPAQTVTLTNLNSVALRVSSILIKGSQASAFSQANNCRLHVLAGQSCTIKLRFSPTVPYTSTASLEIKDNALGSPHIVPLTGSATEVKLVPPSLDFGNIMLGTASAPQTVTLTNIGNTELKLYSTRLAGTNPSDFTYGSNCGRVPPGGSCVFNAKFRPSATGLRGAGIELFDDGGPAPRSISLQGTGTSSKELEGSSK
jgi:hypothetical protein